MIFNEHYFNVFDIELKDSVVHCNVHNEYQKMYLKNGGEYHKDISYYDFSITDTLLDKNEKTFNPSSIESIKYKSVLVNNARFFGSTINVLSIFSALVVAPLISANFRQGEFNSRIYFKTVAWIAVGLCVGIPLST